MTQIIPYSSYILFQFCLALPASWSLSLVLPSLDAIDSSHDISSCLCLSWFRLVSSTAFFVPPMTEDSALPVPRLNPTGATETLVQLTSLDSDEVPWGHEIWLLQWLLEGPGGTDWYRRVLGSHGTKFDQWQTGGRRQPVEFPPFSYGFL